MASDYRKVSVYNVPSILPFDQMHDKLLIHFLRPRNGGGEVIELLYPTEEQGVAFVTFELDEVAEAVLGRKHLLELDKQKFPLKVRRAVESRSKTPEDYMTVETTLDLQLFPDENIVKALVEKYGFMVYSETAAGLRIKGLFPALKKLRDELLTILCKDRRRLLSTPSPTYIMPCAEKQQYLLPSEKAVRPRTLKEVAVASSPRKLEEYSSRIDSATTGSELAHRSSLYGTLMSYSTIPGGPTALTSFVRGATSEDRIHSGDEHGSMIPGLDFNNVSLTQNSEGNRPDKSSASSQGQRRSSFDVGQSLRIHNPHRISRVSNITVDLDALKYVQAFKKQELDQILNSASVQMSVEEQDELGLVTLTSNSSHATSGDMERVSGEVSKFLCSMQQNLRTQDIPLSGVSPEMKAKMTEASVNLANRYLALTLSLEDRLHLIGPSREVFLLKQFLIDQFSPNEHLATSKESVPVGRARRDRSCPASRETKTVKNVTNTVDDRHGYGSARSTGKEHEIAGQTTQPSSLSMVAAKNDRIKRTLSVDRKTMKEVRKMATVPSHAVQNTEQSNSNLDERGREKHRSSASAGVKRALRVLDNFRIRNKI